MKITVRESKLAALNTALKENVKTTAIRLKCVSAILYAKEAWHRNEVKRRGLVVKPQEVKLDTSDGTSPSTTILHLVWREDLRQILTAITAKCVAYGLTTADVEITTDETNPDSTIVFTIKTKTDSWSLTRRHYNASDYLYSLSA